MADSKPHGKHEWIVGLWADGKQPGVYNVDARCKVPNCRARLTLPEIEQLVNIAERSLTRMPRKR